MNLEQARHNMIHQQIKTWDVVDPGILETLSKVPREKFVPQTYQSLAFSEIEIPLGEGEKMLTPSLEAKLLQALKLQPHETVLEIGTGSGYFTALLAKLCRHVYSVEIHANLSRQAKEKLSLLHVHNVTLETGNAANGWSTHAPYDVIVASGSFPSLPKELPKQLCIGGRLLAIIGEKPAMEVTLLERLSDNHFQRSVLFNTVVTPLLCVTQPSRFVF